MKNNYNLHNLMEIVVDSEDIEMCEGYDHYLRYFKTTQSETKSASYEVKDYSTFTLPEKYLSAGDFLRFENGVCFPNEKYALTYESNKITEFTNYANRATNFWLQILLLRKNISFIHSAAVEINGKGFLFPAFGGVGKTTLISELRNNANTKFFGDDFVLLSNDGSMYSYPSDFSIYDYHVPLFSELQNSHYTFFFFKRKYFAIYYFIKKAINFILKRAGLTSKPFLKGWLQPYAKVPAATLINPSKIGTKTTLAASVFLERFSGDKIEIKEISADEQTKMIAAVLSLEFTYGAPYFNALATAVDLESSEFYLKQKEVIGKALSKSMCYRIRIPSKMPVNDYLDQLKNFLNSLAS